MPSKTLARRRAEHLLERQFDLRRAQGGAQETDREREHRSHEQCAQSRGNRDRAPAERSPEGLIITNPEQKLERAEREHIPENLRQKQAESRAELGECEDADEQRHRQAANHEQHKKHQVRVIPEGLAQGRRRRGRELEGRGLLGWSEIHRLVRWIDRAHALDSISAAASSGIMIS